jgi:hypothetical protein
MLVAAAGAAIVSSYSPVNAASKFYGGAAGLWQTGPWLTAPGGSVTTVPTAGDSAFVNGTTSFTVTTNGSTVLTGLATIQLDGTTIARVGLDKTAAINLGATNFVVASTGQASFTSGGGNLSVNNFIIAQNNGSNGTVALSNSSLTILSSMAIGSTGFGELDMTSGSIGVGTSSVPLIIGNSALGIFNLNGGSAVLGQLNAGPGDGGAGIMTLAGGSFSVAGATKLGEPSGNSSGQLYLNSGTASFNGPVTVYGQSTIHGSQGALVNFNPNQGININGGTIQLDGNTYGLSSTNPITLNDGYFGSFNIVSIGGASIIFNAGTVGITGTDFNPATNPILGNGSINLPANKALIVAGRTSLSSSNPIVINGGTFSTGGLNGNPADMQFNSGTFRLTGDTFNVGTMGVFGDTYTIDSAHRIEVAFGNLTTIDAGAQLYINGGALSSDGGVQNSGVLQLGSPTSRISGGLVDNFNLLAGTGRITAQLLNETDGEVRVNSVDTLRFEGNINTNGGLFNLNGGYLDFTGSVNNGPSGRITGRGTVSAGNINNAGSILLSAGLTDVHGLLVNQSGGKTIVSGNATATFYDNITNQPGSEFRVSTGSTAVFFGTVSGLGLFTGSGLKDFEGSALPGPLATPGSSLVGPAGNVSAQYVRESALTVQGELAIVPNGTSSGASRVGALSIDGGQMDLANNALVVDYSAASPIATIRSLLLSGRAGGTWSGEGLRSSKANASTFALGYAEAAAIFSSFPANFFGQSVDNSTVLVRYTRYGDANLDGKVNALDFNALATNFGGSGKVWTQGDYNYDGTVNTQDFTLLAQNFNGVVSDASLGGIVPEPLGLAVFFLASLALQRRRHGSRNVACSQQAVI